ncbi:hypothetical protein DFJ63DRAFT_318292 [Scheffersomyces coipomensis]|uniref:uncharacterized protein n=1 Tax=Scheffersomyces coipomensis TaxID=1788519 RepID=UPI00315CC1EA
MSGGSDITKFEVLAKAWSPKPPKKFSNSLINDVHPLIIHEGKIQVDALARLNESEFFENVLWKFFHEDVTAHHLELLLASALLDHQLKKKANLVTRLDILLNGDVGPLMKRILNVPLSLATSTEYQLIALVFTFIRTLDLHYSNAQSVRKWIRPLTDINLQDDFSYDEPYFQKSSIQTDEEYARIKLQKSWYYIVLSSFNRLILDAVVDGPTFDLLQEELIKLLISGLSQNEPDFIQFVIQMNVYDLLKLSEEVSNSLDILKYFLFQEYTFSEQLTIFKELLLEWNDHKNSMARVLHAVRSVRSSYSEDVLREVVMEYLNIDILKDILENMSLNVPYVCTDHLDAFSSDAEKEILVGCLMSLIFVPDYNLLDTSERVFDFFTERELYDDTHIADSNNLFDYLSDEEYPIFGIQSFSNKDYYNRVAMNLLLKLRKDIKKHIVQVLTRLKIDSNGNRKGKSKYFYEIKESKMDDERSFQVTTKTDFESKNDYILLLELVKPNPHSSSSRLNEFGLNSVKLASIETSKKNSMSLDVPFSDEEYYRSEDLNVRGNCLIVLPDIVPAIDELNLLMRDSTDGKEMFIATQDDKDPKFDYESENESEPEVEHDRKRSKFSNHFKSNKSSYPRIAGDFTFLRNAEDSYFNLKLMESLLLESLSDRNLTLLIVPTETFLKNYEIPSGKSILKYADDTSLDSFIDSLKEKILKLLAKIEYEDMDGFNMKSLTYYEDIIDKAWRKYLNDCVNQTDVTTQIYPFRDDVTDFQEIREDHEDIIRTFETISRLSPLVTSDNLSKAEKWQFMVRNFNIMISYNQYLKLISDPFGFFHSFHYVKVLNGKLNILPTIMAYNTEPPKHVTFYGGEISTALAPPKDFKRNPYLTQPQYQTNPGFEYPYQKLKVESQLQEAEYCVLLYQYMRLLGYPQSKIVIWVSSAIQKALIEEVLRAKCVKNSKAAKGVHAKDASDSADLFQFGWPDVIFNESGEYDYDIYDYAIYSLFGSVDFELPYKHLPGTKGLYYWPKKTSLQIITGENYQMKEIPDFENTRPSNGKFNIEGKDHFEEYISQMTKVRLGN